jgi:FkbH-like protein
VTNSHSSNHRSSAPFRFSIGATFTAEPLRPVIEFWGPRLNLAFETRFAPYNQLEQALLDAGGEFAANTSGVNVIAFRTEDLGGYDVARIRSNTGHLIESLRSAHFQAPAIVCLCPPSKAFAADAQRLTAAEEAAGALANIPGLRFLHYREIADLYPVAEYEAAGGGELGHIPYTETYFAALGTALVRLAHAITRAPLKVIALDCDNTLWAGICGEDGPGGVTVDAPHRVLQQFMKAQRESGMLLAMASKNNEADVLEVFERNPDMPLQLRDFAAWRIDWESKADSLNALSKELNVGLDTFILVDDSAKECAEVETSAPEVLAIALPIDLAETAHFLKHVWAFDHPAVTAEDRLRSGYYEQARKFGAEMRRTSSLEQFIAGLELEVRIQAMTADRLARVAQLTQRTNQFNFTAIRRTEAGIERLLADGAHECFTVEVSDRFGDYGLVGVMIFAPEESGLAIDTFLLSCRALGRGVEHRMMAFLADLTAERRVNTIVARLTPTRQNAPAQQFLDSIGRASDSAAERIFRLPAAGLRALAWKPAAATAVPAAADSAPRVENERRAPEYARIARTLSTPGQIIAEMRRQVLSFTANAPAHPPSTVTEKRLAEIWSDLLQTPSISTSDNFFDLGGHSLLAVLLLVRAHETFGVQLSIDDVYSGAVTLAELAQRIEGLQIGDPESAGYAELLQEIEAMSDEDARRMLAESEPDGGRS